MTPPIEFFPSSALPLKAQTSLTGKRRKDFDGNLKKCERFEMMQYKCEVDEAGMKKGAAGAVVRCWPVERFFRRLVISFEVFVWVGREGA
jgi:hypothetical protein